MGKKSFQAGMVAGAKPFEEKFKKQADAIEKVGARIDGRLDEISGVVDVMMDDLSAQERKRVYDLNTVVDISELDDTEKEYLCSILYALANLNEQLTQLQKDYLRSVKSYLKIVNVQPEVRLESIENIDNITTQKAIMQTIMEFLFLGYGNHDYMDDYEDIFDCFSVNRRGIREIQDGINTMYDTVGLDGIAEHYGITQKVMIIEGGNTSKAHLDLRKKAEEAYLRYDIKSALPLFELLAEQGDARSCYFLGQIYEFGYQNSVCKDLEKATLYRKLGSERGDVLCLLRLAGMSPSTEEKVAVYAENFDIVHALAQNGDIYAMFEVARLFHFGYEDIQDEKMAEYWYKQAADAGLCFAMNNLGNMYLDKEEYETAATYYKRASDIGYENSIYMLAECYSIGAGVDKDTAKASALYRVSAEKGSCIAQCKLGVECIVSEEYKEARKWLTLAKNNGNEKAHYFMAELEARDDTDACYELAETYILDKDYSHDVATKLCGNPNEFIIGSKERGLCNLMFGAHSGDRRAQIELAHECISSSFSGWMIWTWLDKSGFLDLIGREIDFGVQKCAVELSGEKVFQLLSGTLRGKELMSHKKAELEAAANKALEVYAEAGEPAAQYYLGMSYAKKYERSYRDSDKQMALKWLRECYNDVWAPNLDETLKCLSKFIVVNWPPCDCFVGGSYILE